MQCGCCNQNGYLYLWDVYFLCILILWYYPKRVCYNHCCWTTTIASYWHLHLMLFTAGKLRSTGIFFLHFTYFTTHDIIVYNLLTVVTMSNLIGKSMNEPHTCFSQMWGTFMITPFRLDRNNICHKCTAHICAYFCMQLCYTAYWTCSGLTFHICMCTSTTERILDIYIFISSHR